MEKFHLASIEQAIIAIVLLSIILIDLRRTFRRSVLRTRIIIFLVLNILYLFFQFIMDDINLASYQSKALMYFVLICYYSLNIALRASLFMCMEYLIRSKISFSIKMEFSALIFNFITIFLIITTPITHLFFHVDEHYNIITHPFYILINITSYSYLFASVFRGIYCIIITPNKKEKRIYFLMVLFLSIPYISIFSPLDLWDCTTALSILIFYLIIQHENISKDPLTNLNDRTYLTHDIEKLLTSSKKNRLALLMIDGDHFKQINDNYGHIEGDKSLIRVARAITEGTKNLHYVTTARYGGDEFVVCFMESYNREAEVVASKISAKLKEFNILSNSNYSFTVSIGIANYNENIKNASDFIKQADANLYEIKNSR